MKRFKIDSLVIVGERPARLRRYGRDRAGIYAEVEYLDRGEVTVERVHFDSLRQIAGERGKP